MPRKVILGFGLSLDGCIARRNGDLDFPVIDKEGESVLAEFPQREFTLTECKSYLNGSVGLR